MGVLVGKVCIITGGAGSSGAASAEEIARSVLFLAFDQSSFTTGALLMADGGMGA